MRIHTARKLFLFPHSHTSDPEKPCVVEGKPVKLLSGDHFRADLSKRPTSILQVVTSGVTEGKGFLTLIEKPQQGVRTLFEWI